MNTTHDKRGDEDIDPVIKKLGDSMLCINCGDTIGAKDCPRCTPQGWEKELDDKIKEWDRHIEKVYVKPVASHIKSFIRQVESRAREEERLLIAEMVKKEISNVPEEMPNDVRFDIGKEIGYIAEKFADKVLKALVIRIESDGK